MVEAGLIHPVLIFLTVFHATLVLALTTAVLIAWLIVTLSDGPSALMVPVTGALLLTFAIYAALLLAPGFRRRS